MSAVRDVLGILAKSAILAGLHVAEQRLASPPAPSPRPDSIETRRDDRGVYVPILET